MRRAEQAQRAPRPHGAITSGTEKCSSVRQAVPCSRLVAIDQQLAELDRALARLGLPGRTPPRIRVAIRRRRHLRLWLWFSSPAALLYVGVSGYLAAQVPRREMDKGMSTPDAVRQAFASPTVLTVTFVGSVIVAGFLVILTSAAPAASQGVPRRRPRHPSFQMGWLRVARRYALVMEIAETIVAAATAHRAGGERLAPELRKVSRKLGAVTRGISTAHRQRSSVPLLSHRRRALKAHERQVIAAIRACEARLDSDPRPALEELGSLLLTIGDRYCQGQVGALLSDAQLQGVEAGPDREWVRVIVWAALTSGAVFGLSHAGLSDGAEPTIMTLTGLLLAAMIWQRNVRRVFDIIGLVSGK